MNRPQFITAWMSSCRKYLNQTCEELLAEARKRMEEDT
jgi:hypothetical protein